MKKIHTILILQFAILALMILDREYTLLNGISSKFLIFMLLASTLSLVKLTNAGKFNVFADKICTRRNAIISIWIFAVLGISTIVGYFFKYDLTVFFSLIVGIASGFIFIFFRRNKIKLR